MSSTYDWPGFGVNSFEMKISHNTRAFISPFSSTSQVLNYTGERWAISLALTPGNSVIDGAAKEAFFDRLYGPANRVRLWNLRRPQPLGTIRDGSGAAQWKTATNTNATWQTSAPAAATWGHVGPRLSSAVAVGASQLPLARTAGDTIRAGDHLGVGGQLFRAMADYTLDSVGLGTVEVQPRVRAALASGAAVTLTKPTAEFMLKTDGPSVVWRPGMHEGFSVDFVEAL